MSYTENNCLSAKHSTVQQRQRTKRASKSEPQTVQIIHQLIIPEHPQGLIGQKVTYNEGHLKRLAKIGAEPFPLPPCGYFIILQAVLRDDGNVMVKLSDHEMDSSFLNGTHICVRNLKPYK